MSIDWAKAEEAPQKSQKVEGRFLLDLRSKVNDLEKQLTETKGELAQTQTDLNSTKGELESTKSTLESTTSALESTKAALDKANADSKTALGAKDQELSNVKSELDGVKNQLAEAKGKITELEGSVKAKEEQIADFFETAFFGTVLENGIRVGFPLSQSINLIYYNSTWANELGFDSAPKSIDEFKDQACAATAANADDDNPNNDGTGGLVMYTGSSNVVSWIFSFGGNIISNDFSGYDFTTPETESVSVFLKELWDDGCAFTTQSYPHPEFATRKALFIMNSSVGIPYQLDAFEADDAFPTDEWIFIPFVGPEGGEAVNAFSQTIGMVNTTPEKNLAAWLFLKYISSPETQATWIKGSAYYPTRKSVPALLTDYATANPQWKTGQDLLAIGNSEPARASWATVRREVQNTFSAILQGDYDQIVPLLEELDAIAAEAVAKLDR